MIDSSIKGLPAISCYKGYCSQVTFYKYVNDHPDFAAEIEEAKRYYQQSRTNDIGIVATYMKQLEDIGKLGIRRIRKRKILRKNADDKVIGITEVEEVEVTPPREWHFRAVLGKQLAK